MLWFFDQVLQDVEDSDSDEDDKGDSSAPMRDDEMKARTCFSKYSIHLAVVCRLAF
jgi:hypothetical protein